jgi:hypothetical protein
MSTTVHISTEESAATTVVEAVADETGRAPSDLPTLYDVVDPDALNQLVDRTRLDREPNVTVTFAMAGCRVEVTDTGAVAVECEERREARSDAARTEVPEREAAAVETSGAVESSASGLAFEGSR